MRAVRQVGSNAIPVLARLIRAHDSGLKLRLINLAKKQTFLKINYIPAADLNYIGVHGLILLGEHTGAAIPELIQILNGNISTESKDMIILALRDIGGNATAVVPQLLRMELDEKGDLRRHVIWALAAIHEYPEIVVPRLIQILHDQDFKFRVDAAEAIGAYHARATFAVPDLVAAMQDPSENVRTCALRARYLIDPNTAANVELEKKK